MTRWFPIGIAVALIVGFALGVTVMFQVMAGIVMREPEIASVQVIPEQVGNEIIDKIYLIWKDGRVEVK